MNSTRRHMTNLTLVVGLALCLGVAASARPVAPATGSAQARAIVEGVIERLNEQTDAHFHEGEYNHYVSLTRMVVAAWPNDVEGYANAGWLLWSMDKDDDAVALYKQGLKANPNSFYMYDELGLYYFNRKRDWPTAISFYEKAVACKDVQPMTVHMLAHAYEKNGQLEKALEMWQRAANMPNNEPVQANMERVQKLIAAKNAGK